MHIGVINNDGVSFMNFEDRLSKAKPIFIFLWEYAKISASIPIKIERFIAIIQHER